MTLGLNRHIVWRVLTDAGVLLPVREAGPGRRLLMRTTYTLLFCLALLPSTSYAAQGPEIDVVDGKISMSVQAVPLGRLISLLDRTMGFTSQVKPELANRNISVRFTGLEIKDAVQKIFEGQPLNYVFIEGKGIRVTDLAQGGGAVAPPLGSSFPSSQSSAPISSPQPIVTTPPFPVGNPIQQGNPQPANAATQPAQVITPFGNQPNPNPAGAPAATPGAPTPGQLPPPIGTSNPLITPVGATPAAGGFPASAPAPAPQQPPVPGALPGATPGVSR